jgi:hypothetical protein
MAAAAPVCLCPGNHDAPGDLEIFGKLKAKWPVIVQTTPAVLHITLPTGGTAALAVLPYPTKAGLVSVGVAHADLGAVARDALEAIFMVLAHELQQARDAGELPLFMGHVNVGGSRASNGQPQIGVEIELDQGLLARLPAAYIGLNHIHLPQTVNGAVYAGSIARLDFGETEEKRYVAVTVSDDPELRPAIISRPLDVTPLYQVEGTLSRDGFTWSVVKGPGGEPQPAPASWKGCEVRVRYRFPQAEKSVLDTAQILATFAEAKRLELEPVAQPDRALRAPEVASAVTLADKLAAWCRLSGADLSATLADKLALLERGDSAQVLAGVERATAPVETEQEAMAL